MTAQYALRGSHYIVQTFRPASQSSQPLLLYLYSEPGWSILSVEYFVSQSVLSPVVRVLDHLVVGGPGSTTIRVIVWRISVSILTQSVLLPVRAGLIYLS